jgi:hypothetical protein
MKAEEQTLLNGILSTIFKLDGEQMSRLYNSDGDLTDLSVVSEADTKRVTKFNTEKTAQYNRGIKEGAEKIEKSIKEKYGESDLIGVELIESIVVKQVADATKEGQKDISKHPEYVKLAASINEKLSTKDKEWEGKLKDKETEFNREKLFDKVKDKALVSFDARKPILSTDPKKAQAWKDTYLGELRSGNYQEDDNGKIIVLNKDGKIMEDEHGHPVTFDQFEKGIFDKYFDIPVAEQRSSTGNQSTDSKSQNVGEPKTKAEALEKLKDPKITPENRKKYTDLMDTLKT